MTRAFRLACLAALVGLGLATAPSARAETMNAPAADYMKKGGHKGFKAFKGPRGRAYGYYKAPRRYYAGRPGRRVGWYKKRYRYARPAYRAYYRY